MAASEDDRNDNKKENFSQLLRKRTRNKTISIETKTKRETEK